MTRKQIPMKFFLIFFVFIIGTNISAQSEWMPANIESTTVDSLIDHYLQITANTSDTSKYICGSLLQVADFVEQIVVEKCDGPIRWNYNCYGGSMLVRDLKRNLQHETFYLSFSELKSGVYELGYQSGEVLWVLIIE